MTNGSDHLQAQAMVWSEFNHLTDRIIENRKRMRAGLPNEPVAVHEHRASFEEALDEFNKFADWVIANHKTKVERTSDANP